jgi:hypothetical protein
MKENFQLAGRGAAFAGVHEKPFRLAAHLGTVGIAKHDYRLQKATSPAPVSSLVWGTAQKQVAIVPASAPLPTTAGVCTVPD